MTAPEILECGHTPTPDAGIGTGYARDPETGARMCYPCADTAQREDMRTASDFVAYLSRDARTITTWSGGELGRVTAAWDSRAARKTYVRVRDVHGAEWYGSGPLESGTYVRLHRARPAPCVWAVWDGGANYSPGEIPRDVETFPTRTAARDALTDRARHGHYFPQSFTYADGRTVSTHTPGADSGARMSVYLTDPRGVSDPTPDFVYELTDRDTVRKVKV